MFTKIHLSEMRQAPVNYVLQQVVICFDMYQGA